MNLKQHLEFLKAINEFFESTLFFFKKLAEFEWTIHKWRIKYIKENFSKIQKYKHKNKFISIDKNRNISDLLRTTPIINDILKWQDEMEFMSIDN